MFSWAGQHGQPTYHHSSLLNCHKIQSFRKHCLHGEEQWEILFFTTHDSHLSHWNHFFFFFVRRTILSAGDQSVADTITTKLTGRYINYRTRDSRRKNPLGFSTAPRWVWKSDLWRWVSGARCEKSPCCWSLCFSSTLGMPPSQVTPFATNLHAVPLFLAFLGWANNVAVIREQKHRVQG